MGASLQDKYVLNKMLSSLPESYRHVRTAWSLIPAAERTIDNLTERLINEEKVVESYARSTSTIGNSGASAFQATGQYNQRSKYPKLYNSKLSLILFTEKNLDNAYSATNESNYQGGANRGRRGFGGRMNYRGVKRGGVDTHYYRKDKGKVNFQAPQKAWACIFCQVDTHMTVDCRKLGRAREMFQEQFPKQEKGFPASPCFATRSIFDWFADSGATSHMTDQRSLMTNYIPLTPGTWMVNGIGGSNLPVHGQGEITVITEVYGLHNVSLNAILKMFTLTREVKKKASYLLCFTYQT